ncbi:MAG: helix-turn-helix transcriptional regulator [Odoribacteraceae bacterium]|jgi:AraC-like DNA-binding protein|nr:helix-turn-helix transcriptional regulator [Odoribacteraceae bacterium]
MKPKTGNEEESRAEFRDPSRDAFRVTLSRVANTLRELLDKEISDARRHELSLALDDAISLARHFPFAGLSPSEAFLQRVAFLVEQNINNARYTVNDLATGLGMSRATLYRQLYAITRQTPSVFIRTARLHQAASLLRDTTSRVSEVAYMVGFRGLKYFNKHFKEIFDITPSIYRRRVRVQH